MCLHFHYVKYENIRSTETKIGNCSEIALQYFDKNLKSVATIELFSAIFKFVNFMLDLQLVLL